MTRRASVPSRSPPSRFRREGGLFRPTPPLHRVKTRHGGLLSPAEALRLIFRREGGLFRPTPPLHRVEMRHGGLLSPAEALHLVFRRDEGLSDPSRPFVASRREREGFYAQQKPPFHVSTLQLAIWPPPPLRQVEIWDGRAWSHFNAMEGFSDPPPPLFHVSQPSISCFGEMEVLF